MKVVNAHTEPHEVMVAVSDSDGVVVLESISVPAAHREQGTLHGETVSMDAPAEPVPDFTVHATLAGRDEIRRFGVDFFGPVGEDSTVYVELSVERDGRLVILYTANPNFMD